MALLLNLVRKDFLRNKVITSALAVFLIIAALFMASGLRVAGTMISSLKGLNELAAMTDYLQMHNGRYDEDAFERFVGEHDYIEASLVVDMLNIKNASIIYQGETLEKYLMDNGFVVQNDKFDFLLNLENEIAVVAEGEIGVPVYYAQELDIQAGDVISLQEGDYSKNLSVSTIIRDSSMNPALTSSKRFLVSQADLDDMVIHMGDREYLFEFLLKDGTSAAELEKDYMNAGMPSNGVALSGSALIMLNALSYGVIAFIIIAISFILILISMLCLSYIIRATMADENVTIGEMKAIGFPGKEIGKLYQMKYLILALAAGVIGYLSAIPLGDFFASSVVMYCGRGTDQWMAWGFPLVGVVLLSLSVIYRCRKIIQKNLKNSVVELMRGEEMKKNEGHFSLPHAGLKHHNLAIALGELKCKWKEYVVIFLIFAVSSFLILLPMNMKHTIENPSFMTYMGVGESDFRIDIQHSETMAEQKALVQSYLVNDPQITKHSIYHTGYVQFQNAADDWEYLRVGSGDESVFPLSYLEGNSPDHSREIALSYLLASQSEKEVGETLTVMYQGEKRILTISGIYQDITYGGKTAKAAIDFEEGDIEVFIIYADVSVGAKIEDKTDELRKILTNSKVTPINEFVSQTLGGIMDDMTLVERAAIVLSFFLIILITVMFLQLVTAREREAIAIKKAIGFTSRDIRIQLGIRTLIIQIGAIIVGTVLSNTLGERIFGLMLSSMGASRIIMLVDPIKAYLIYPSAQVLTVFITVIVGTEVVRKYHIKNQIKE